MTFDNGNVDYVQEKVGEGRGGWKGKVSRNAIVQGFGFFGQQGGKNERGHHNENSTSLRDCHIWVNFTPQWRPFLDWTSVSEELG